MKRLSKPNIAYQNVFETCINSIKNTALKNELSTKKYFFTQAETKYIELAENFTLESFINYESKVTDNSIITHNDLVDLYSKLRDNKEPKIYHDTIKNSHDRCLYCNLGKISSLDHYLPKEDFPLLSITPSNLIPCCSDCNFKLNDLFRIYNKNPPLAIHPYFEHHNEIYNKQWVFASIPENQSFFTEKKFNALGVKFYTDFKNITLDSSTINRLEFQFEHLLKESYARCSADPISKELNRVWRTKGNPTLIKRIHKAYLLDIMEDWPINTYNHATYYALANSDLYLETIEREFFLT